MTQDTIERYEFCLKLLIAVICDVADGKMSIEEVKQFRAEMEAGEFLSEIKN